MQTNDRSPRRYPPSTQGFTLLETLVVLVIIGVLATIAASTWSTFFENRKLVAAQDRTLQAIRHTQFSAKSRQANQIIGFRNVKGIAYWAIYSDKAHSATATWQMIHDQVQIDTSSTLRQTNNIYQIEFNFKGNTSNLGRLTLSNSNATRPSKLKRCVIVSTLLGHLRTGQESGSASKPACD